MLAVDRESQRTQGQMGMFASLIHPLRLVLWSGERTLEQ